VDRVGYGRKSGCVEGGTRMEEGEREWCRGVGKTSITRSLDNKATVRPVTRCKKDETAAQKQHISRTKLPTTESSDRTLSKIDVLTEF